MYTYSEYDGITSIICFVTNNWKFIKNVKFTVNLFFVFLFGVLNVSYPLINYFQISFQNNVSIIFAILLFLLFVYLFIDFYTFLNCPYRTFWCKMLVQFFLVNYSPLFWFLHLIDLYPKLTKDNLIYPVRIIKLLIVYLENTSFTEEQSLLDAKNVFSLYYLREIYFIFTSTRQLAFI